MPESSVVKSIAENVTFLKWLLGGIVTSFTVVMGALYQKLGALAVQQNTHEVEVAKTYASKNDL